MAGKGCERVKAYKCDLCLKYTDSIVSVSLPRFNDGREKYYINEICNECYKKLQDWVQENAANGKR